MRSPTLLLFVSLVLASASAQTDSVPYYFATLAGDAGYGSADGTGSAAQFFSPAGVAVDGSGNTYVADASNHTVRKISPGGTVTTFAGLAGSPGSSDGSGSAARFNNPMGVAVDSSGNVYVADSSNHKIRKITPDAEVSTFAGTGDNGYWDSGPATARFHSPGALVVDNSGTVYVADTRNRAIRTITSYSWGMYVATLATISGNTAPVGIGIDNALNLYVAGQSSHTIFKVTADGVVTTFAGLTGSAGTADGTGSAARFSIPQGVAVDGDGNVYVGDSGNHTVRKITAAGAVTTLVGLARVSGGADGILDQARFNRPFGVAVDNSGNVYVADERNHAIRKVTAGGVATTLAGVRTSGSEDGRGSAARFNRPYGVAVDVAGTAYVADYWNRTIRKITSRGVVSTVAGLPGIIGSADGTGSGARFNDPHGVAVDGSGSNVYVADTVNHTIRRITSGGVVSTLAGRAGSSGSSDGVGSSARFSLPYAVAVDGDGAVYVADRSNFTVRKITSAGVVSTLAGLAGSWGSTDGTGSAARFYTPNGVATNSSANIYVADYLNSIIRKITPGAVVSTLAGAAGLFGSADGVGSAARFYEPNGVAVDNSGTVYIADSSNGTIRKITSTGIVSTIGGLPRAPGRTDGVGSNARFSYPSGIAVDPAGNLFIADANNNSIRYGVPQRVLALSSAVSRKQHGDAGAFDIDLPAAGTPGVECRATAGAHTIVLQFTNPVAAAAASIISGNGIVEPMPEIDRDTVIVQLHGVANSQPIEVKVSDVQDVFGQVMPEFTIRMNVLIGDANGNGTVNASDVGLVKSQSGSAVGATNFRSDLNASGSITASDIGLVKSQSGSQLP